MYTRGKTIVGVPLPDGSMYVMDGPGFQKKILHGIPPISNALMNVLKKNKMPGCPVVGPRLALTFRYNGEKQPRNDVGSHNDRVLCADLLGYEGLRITQFYTEYTFKEVYDIVSVHLKPDVAKLWGKVYTNNGRQAAMFTSTRMKNYKYGGKAVEAVQMPPQLVGIMKHVEKEVGAEFNWVHAVLYPEGGCKLNFHGDNEKEIAIDSAIAGLSLYKNLSTRVKVR